ncbi:sensor histidine kinase [Natronincola ferrireducens]|uniref:Histidine kinase-, DNA gyrase B-, and HSP90-like ATPase n=1 Tax=Natronincola ferrireducens TaxID=393762 RepID=A0A1G8YRG0_9FIRM|nr:sensor histidine kinase [Natronincola ferrireducens]SDK05327.1 Histidine kinase-, DNA gyrase B-, and HSP90-like ATPase [Natronincola ferrireducens]
MGDKTLKKLFNFKQNPIGILFLIICFVCIILPMSFNQFLSYNNYVLDTREHIIESNYKALSDINHSIYEFTVRIENELEYISRNTVISNYTQETEEMDIALVFNDFIRLNKKIGNIYFVDVKNRDLFLTQNLEGLVSYKGKQQIYNSSEYDIYSTAYNGLQVKWHPYHISGITNQRVISALKIIYNWQKSEVVGYIVIEIPLEVFSSSITHNNFGQRNRVIVLDKNNNVIAHTNEFYLGREFENQQIIDALDTNFLGDLFINDYYSTGYYNYRKFPKLDFNLIAYVPQWHFSNLVKPMRNSSMTVVAISIVFGIISSIILAQYLISQIKVREQKQELKRRETELNALQVQINPHFLYNTLESIRWMAEIDNATEAVDMIMALSELFRRSSKNPNDLVTVEEEIECLKHYLFIQQKRYGDKFEVAWNVPKNLLKCKMIKFILQPIIENCLEHGIADLEEYGKITIRACLKEKSINFTIADNGKGIDSNKLELIRNKLEGINTEKIGIGISNVHERLKLYYGNEYGIEIKSCENKGTEITIKLGVIPS